MDKRKYKGLLIVYYLIALVSGLYSIIIRFINQMNGIKEINNLNLFNPLELSAFITYPLLFLLSLIIIILIIFKKIRRYHLILPFYYLLLIVTFYILFPYASGNNLWSLFTYLDIPISVIFLYYIWKH